MEEEELEENLGAVEEVQTAETVEAVEEVTVGSEVEDAVEDVAVEQATEDEEVVPSEPTEQEEQKTDEQLTEGEDEGEEQKPEKGKKKGKKGGDESGDKVKGKKGKKKSETDVGEDEDDETTDTKTEIKGKKGKKKSKVDVAEEEDTTKTETKGKKGKKKGKAVVQEPEAVEEKTETTIMEEEEGGESEGEAEDLDEDEGDYEDEYEGDYAGEDEGEGEDTTDQTEGKKRKKSKTKFADAPDEGEEGDEAEGTTDQTEDSKKPKKASISKDSDTISEPVQKGKKQKKGKAKAGKKPKEQGDELQPEGSDVLVDDKKGKKKKGKKIAADQETEEEDEQVDGEQSSLQLTKSSQMLEDSDVQNSMKVKKKPSKGFKRGSTIVEDKEKMDSSSSSSDVMTLTRAKSKSKSQVAIAKKKVKTKVQVSQESKESKEDGTQEGPVEDEGKKTKKGKKDKKAKKGKKKETKPDEVDEILSEIVTEQKGAKKAKPKGGKTKKMTPDMLEKQKELEEKAAKKLAEEERRKRLEEFEAATEQEKKEAFEQYLRVEQLLSGKVFRAEIRTFNETLEIEEDERTDWETYIKCGLLPSGSSCKDITTYMYVWEQEIETTTPEQFSKRTSDVLEILDDIENAVMKLTSTEENNINVLWAKQLLRDCQSRSLDITAYQLLRFVETRMNPVSLNISDYHFKDDNVTFSIWLRKRMPIPLPNPRRPPKPRIDVNFDALNMSVLCPLSLDEDGIAIRAVYLSYDHYSDRCETFAVPEISPLFKTDILQTVINEWRTKQKYKYDHRIRVPKIIQVEGENGEMIEKTIEEEEIEIGPDDPIPEVPYRKLDPTPSEYVLSLEDQFYADTRQDMYRVLPENVVNLRQYSILGGIYKVDLLVQPPQPHDFILMEMYITALYLPKELEFKPFFVDYTPPTPPEEGSIRTPEEIEEELKKTEQEMDQLILITLKWPEHVLFLDLPFVCFWDPENLYWTKEDVFDLKHVEEAGTLSFRTRRFGTFALGNLRYSHLPFQTWELKPEEDGSATLQVTSAVLMFEFNVKENMVSLTQLQNCPSNILKDVIGKYYKLHHLIQLMKDAGIDIFPTHDAFCYVEGVSEKHFQMEQHCMRNMAQMYNSFNFTWSRWNATLGRRSLVFQMREYTPNKFKQKNFSMVLVTVLKATFVECTEISPNFVATEPEGLKFCANLFQLMKATSNIATRTAVQNGNKQCIYTLRYLLKALRLHSFSS